MLLAGVARDHWPKLRAQPERLANARPLDGPLPPWQRAAALGEPARNLFLAGAIVDASGDAQSARAYLERAAELGLVEAQQLLARTH
jgi:TPR repeat protein